MAQLYLSRGNRHHVPPLHVPPSCIGVVWLPYTLVNIAGWKIHLILMLFTRKAGDSRKFTGGYTKHLLGSYHRLLSPLVYTKKCEAVSFSSFVFSCFLPQNQNGKPIFYIIFCANSTIGKKSNLWGATGPLILKGVFRGQQNLTWTPLLVHKEESSPLKILPFIIV